MITFDPAKDAGNLGKHRIALSTFVAFDAQPVVVADDRHDYGERRLRAYKLAAYAREGDATI